jgi:hypothetical protein
MTFPRFEQRAYNALAAHHRYRDEFAKAFRVLRRFPIYTTQGAANHHKLNGDIFDRHLVAGELAAAIRETGQDAEPHDGAAVVTAGKAKRTAEDDALAARRHQDAEYRAEMQRIADEAMGGNT